MHPVSPARLINLRRVNFTNQILLIVDIKEATKKGYIK